MPKTFIVRSRSAAEDAFIRDLLQRLGVPHQTHTPDDAPIRKEVERLYRHTSACPPGYDTVLGYLVKRNPEALELIEDPAEDTKRDGFKLCHMAGQRGCRVVKVAAPPILQERGITEVNAYPISLLRLRLGD
jgi:hypothetical protein